jgi:hypothetical protein
MTGREGIILWKLSLNFYMFIVIRINLCFLERLLQLHFVPWE